MGKIRQMLDDEIERELEDISLKSPGTDTIGVAIGDLATLYRLELDEGKADTDYDEKVWKRDLEMAKLELEKQKFEFEQDKESRQILIQDQQAAEQKRDRWIKIGLEAASIGLTIITLGVYNKWANKGFKFEETGALTSSTFRNLFGKFKLKK